MKILNIIEEGRFGGPQKRIAEVSHHLYKKGVNTLVLIPKTNSEKTKRTLNKLGITYKTIRLHRLTKDIRHLFGYAVFFIPEILSIKKTIKEEKIDIVHCNGSWQYKGIIAARLAGVKSVWHLNDTSMPLYILTVFNFIAKYFASNYIFACERSQLFYFNNSKFLAKPDASQIIQAPVDTNMLSPKKFNTEALSKYAGTKVLTVGNVVPVKGHDTFIEMVNYLSKITNKEIHFFIAGSEWDNQASYINKLKQKVNKYGLNNIHFLGSRSDIPDLLDSTDFYVCSSDFEASPISIWEAMSMGKAIVSTDVGDVKYIFSKHKCGLVVDTQDFTSLGKQLLQLINDKSAKTNYEVQARKTAEKLLDVKICANKHLNIYREIFKQQNNTG